MANAKRPSAAKPKGNVSPGNTQPMKPTPTKKFQMPAKRVRPGSGKAGGY